MQGLVRSFSLKKKILLSAKSELGTVLGAWDMEKAPEVSVATTSLYLSHILHVPCGSALALPPSPSFQDQG